MKYKDVECGMRVITPKGLGVVRSYDAKVPALTNLFGGRRRSTYRAHVALDTGKTVSIPISKLEKIRKAKK